MLKKIISIITIVCLLLPLTSSLVYSESDKTVTDIYSESSKGYVTEYEKVTTTGNIEKREVYEELYGNNIGDLIASDTVYPIYKFSYKKQYLLFDQHKNIALLYYPKIKSFFFHVYNIDGELKSTKITKDSQLVLLTDGNYLSCLVNGLSFSDNMWFINIESDIEFYKDGLTYILSPEFAKNDSSNFETVTSMFATFHSDNTEEKGMLLSEPRAVFTDESFIGYSVTNSGVEPYGELTIKGTENVVSYNLRGFTQIEQNKDGMMANKISYELNNIEQNMAQAGAEEDSSNISSARNNWENLSYYEKWMAAINSYDLYLGNTNAQGALNKEGFNVGPLLTYPLGQLDQWHGDTPTISETGGDDSLTQAQYIALQTYASILYNSRGYNESGEITQRGEQKYNKVALGHWIITEESLNSLQDEIILNENGIKAGHSKTEADSIVKEDYGVNVITDSSFYAGNYDTMVVYLLSRIAGYSMGNEGEVDEGKLRHNLFIKEMENGLRDWRIPISFSSKLPTMSKLRAIANTLDSYTSYQALNYLNLIVENYASSSSVSGITIPEGSELCTNPELESFLETNNAEPNLQNIKVPAKIAKWITTYLSILDGFEYLGIEPWTAQLDYILSKKEAIRRYADNKSILDYNMLETTEPLKELFNVQAKRLSDDYIKGVLLSSTYVPMQTNLYDPNSLQCLDELEWVERFHYKYGFYRKAVFIDDNINSVVDYYIQNGKRGNLRPATLKDILNNAGDIALYVDDNFYNIKKLADIQGYTYNKITNTEEAEKDGTLENPIDWFSTMFDMDVENIVKSGPVTKYSDNVKGAVYQYDEKHSVVDIYRNIMDGSVLSTNSISNYLSDTEYSEMQAFAVVSAIYRHEALYTILQNESNKPSPVFMSSYNLAGVVGVGKKELNTLYNYALVRNLTSKQGIDYKTALDMDSNVYIDIYGNIVTESGLVIIPAASNATLNSEKTFSPLSTGFLSLYGSDYSIESNYSTNETFNTFIEKYFVKNEEAKCYDLKGDVNVGSNLVTIQHLPFQDKEVLKLLLAIYEQDTMSGTNFDFDKRVYLMTEVLRGAPLENINKELEGLVGVRDASKLGSYMAYKLEELSNQLLSSSNGNSVVTLPNPAYMDGVEYVVLFAYKILFAVMIVVLLFKLYIDAVKHRFGIKSFISFISTMLLFVVGITFVPSLLNMSYYEINKILLQDEMQKLSILNLEKESDGREIGVIEVTAPTSKTELYIKLDDLEVPWYTVFGKVLTDNSVKTMSEMYEKTMEAHHMSGLPGIESKSNGLYMSTKYLLNTSSIEYNASRKFLKHTVHETPYASYVTPYYVILNSLVSDVNAYNLTNNNLAFTTKIQSRGSVKTLDMCTAYFTSNEFMLNDTDPLGFHQLYGDQTTLTDDNVAFTDEEYEQMKNSLWYAPDRFSENARTEKLNKLDQRARMYIAKNREYLGKVTDETFIKMMALDLALYHNNLFGIPAAKGLEIMDVDTRDIMRLSMADSTLVMKQSSSSFSRFVYDNGGMLGVILSAILIVVYFVSSLVKPLLILFILVQLTVTVFYRKLVRASHDRCVEGFIVTVGLLCGTNLVYALMLKASFMLPQIGCTMAVSILLQIVLQILYFLVMSVVISILIRDWASMGFNLYQKTFGKLTLAITNGVAMATSKIENRGPIHNAVAENRMKRNYRGSSKTKGLTGEDILREMKERDEKKEEDKKE